MLKNKICLITGVSSGIGKALAQQFINNGHKVFGLDIQENKEIERLNFIKCDITSQKDLTNIKNHFIDDGIVFDMIINVAGIHKMASLVESNFDDLKKIIDVNLCGTMLVNNTFHSLLARNGKIIIVTSEVAAYDPLPFNGIYNISKNALESYAQALRQELNLLNQKVITFQPGAIETPLSNNSLSDTQLLASNTKLYKNQANNFMHLVKNFMGKPISTTKLAKFIYKKTIKNKNKYTYKIHRSFGLVLLNMLSKRLQCFIVKLLLNKKRKITRK